jgi:aspartate carbamoyltransferase regulatory subunit
MIKELKVSAIENGTVIDHIPSKSVFQVIKILNLDKFEDQILFGTNLESKKYGTKGIIKVSNKFFKKSDINKIAIVAPMATLIIIKNFQVIEKTQVQVPKVVQNMVKCFNPNCITNAENIETRFDVIHDHDNNELNLKCHYCEKITKENDRVFI